MIQNNYNTKMSSLLNASDVNMNFENDKIEYSGTPLNCNVDYSYTIYDTDGNEQLSGNNIRKFEFENNEGDCTYTLLNMGISQTAEDNIESRIASTSFVL